MYSPNWTNSFASLPDTFYSRVKPTPFEQPARWVHFNEAAAELLGIDAQQDRQALLDWLSGRTLPEGADPVAMLYAGHPPDWAAEIAVSCSS
jgi:uncharacterized protein YdiU (UPF0061 family)